MGSSNLASDNDSDDDGADAKVGIRSSHRYIRGACDDLRPHLLQ